MRVTGHPEGRFLGYVQVRVASRVYALPVEAVPMGRGGDSAKKSGFFAEGADRLGILIDSDASDEDQREAIERASAEAARHLSRKLLN